MSWKRVQTLILLLFTTIYGGVGVASEKRAKFNYMIHCQGCHLHDGSGLEGEVPSLQGYVSNFLRVAGGREFLVRVPGSANSPFSDTELAELLNWMVLTFDAKHLPESFKSYSPKEVGILRKDAFLEVATVRRAMVENIENLDLINTRGGLSD